MINPHPGRSIVLQSYLGHLGDHISNSIDVDPTPGMIALARQQYVALLATVGVLQVAPPTGRYNCHGLVFASRRTNIPAPGDESIALINRILADDQYAAIAETDAQEGDVAVWRQARDIVHTGIVSHVERHPIRVIFIWSMWGGLGEFIHRVPHTPYPDCVVEYWRLA